MRPTGGPDVMRRRSGARSSQPRRRRCSSRCRTEAPTSTAAGASNADFPTTIYPSGDRDRRSWAILRPVAFPKCPENGRRRPLGAFQPLRRPSPPSLGAVLASWSPWRGPGRDPGCLSPPSVPPRGGHDRQKSRRGTRFDADRGGLGLGTPDLADGVRLGGPSRPVPAGLILPHTGSEHSL